MLKRIFDFTCALIGLIFLLPVFGVVALLIKRDSAGPVFYWCERTGKGGKTFRMLKFRTMFDGPCSDQGPKLTRQGDPRITPFGHWLRDSKVNELPQLWNVLIGEMSLVGPRPEDPTIARMWPGEACREILSIRPGITSPASILYHDEENLLATANVMGDYLSSIMPNKMRLDRLYVKNRAFASDLDILFWTLVIILPKMTRNGVSESSLFSGVIYRVVNRYISWFFIDLATSFLVVGAAGLVWRMQGPLNWGLEYFSMLALILAFAFSAVNVMTGLNRIEWSRATSNDAIHLIFCGLVFTTFLVVLNAFRSYYAWEAFPPLPMGMIFIIGPLAQLGFLLTRYRWRVLTALPKVWLNMRKNAIGVGERVLIVGDGEGFEVASWLLSRKKYDYTFSVVGLVADDILAKRGMRMGGCPVLGRIYDIPEIVEKYDVGVILFTIADTDPDIRKAMAKYGRNPDVRLVFLDKLMNLVDAQLRQTGAVFSNPFTKGSDLGIAAVHDELTGLPNRFLFNDRLQHSLAYAHRYQTELAVILIDLDATGNLRETYSQATNQQVRVGVTKRLAEAIRACDTLACLGEYEFALIIENITSPKIMEGVTNRIFTALSKPFELDGSTVGLCINLRICAGAEIENEKDILANFYTHMMDARKGSVAVIGSQRTGTDYSSIRTGNDHRN